MNCAINSLPLPLSPVMNTEASERATFRATSIICRNELDTPRTVILSLCPCSLSSSTWAWCDSFAAIAMCAARPTSTCSWVAEKGFGK